MTVRIYHDVELNEDLVVDESDPFEKRHPLAATPTAAVEAEFGPDLKEDVIGPAYDSAGMERRTPAEDAAWERICEKITAQTPDGRYYVPQGGDIATLMDGGGPSFYEVIDRDDVDLTREDVAQFVAEARADGRA